MVRGSMAHGPMACTSVHGSWDQHGTGSLREGRVKGEKGSILPSRRTQQVPSVPPVTTASFASPDLRLHRKRAYLQASS